MATAHDVAAFIKAQLGDVDPLTLQKLLYYAQGWTLAWDGRRLFNEPFEAWSYGPVVPDVWRSPRDLFTAAAADGADAGNLDPQEAANVAAVVRFYNQYTGNQLMRMTHREAPWKDAHGDRPEFAKSTEVITDQSMLRYFVERLHDDQRRPRRQTVPREPIKDEEFSEVWSEELARMRHVLDGMDPR